MTFDVNIKLPEVPPKTDQAVSEVLREFIPVANELAGAVCDLLKDYRRRRFLQATTRAIEILRNAGRKPTAVPPKFFLPWASHASLESSDALVEWWAYLLANSACGYTAQHSMFANVLSMLAQREASILSRMYQRALESNAIPYYMGEKTSGHAIPRSSLAALECGDLDQIRRTHPLQRLDEMRIDPFGQLFVRDALANVKDEARNARGIVLPDADFDLVAVADGLQQLGLVEHYGVGRAFSDSETYYYWWCNLHRFGIQFLESVSRVGKPSESMERSQ